MQLGKLGVWTFTDAMTAPQVAEFAARIESLGYSAFWFPEAIGRESFSHAAWLLANTERLVIATGIASIYARDAMASAQAQKTLAEQSGGRFLLTLGVSHGPMVEAIRGHRYERPVRTMRDYLERMQKAPYVAVAPSEPPPTLIAALGPRMLALAAEKTAGAHPYLVPPEHTARAREILGPERWLCPEQKVLLQNDPAKAREIARKALAVYLSLPNYRRNLMTLGFEEAELNDGGSDRLIDSVVAWGDEKQIEQRVRAHLEAGADHVCIPQLHPEGQPLPDLRILEAMAQIFPRD